MPSSPLCGDEGMADSFLASPQGGDARIPRRAWNEDLLLPLLHFLSQLSDLLFQLLDLHVGVGRFVRKQPGDRLQLSERQHGPRATQAAQSPEGDPRARIALDLLGAL